MYVKKNNEFLKQKSKCRIFLFLKKVTKKRTQPNHELTLNEKRDVLTMLTQNISYAKIAAQMSISKGVIIPILYKSFLSIK
jgi:hypothetical protein